MDLVYHLPINGGPTLLLRPMESTTSELKALLSAYYGMGAECVGLQTRDTAYCLSAVAARPDTIYSFDNIKPIFAPSKTSHAHHHHHNHHKAARDAAPSDVQSVERDDTDVFIKELGQVGLLSANEVQTLLPLKDSEFVKAALEVYDVEKDLDDLVDTLQRIVTIRSPTGRAATIAMNRAGGAVPTTTTNRGGGDSPVITQLSSIPLRLAEFPTAHVEEIILSLSTDGRPPVLNAEEALVLAGLVPKQHPLLQAAYESFNETGEETMLIHHLKVLGRHFGLSHAVGDSHDRVVILDAFAQGEPRVWAAWDVYVDEHDFVDFADTLARCLKRMAPPPTNGGTSSDYKHGAAATDAKTVARRVVINLHSTGRVDDENGAKLMGMVDAGAVRAIDAAETWLASSKTDQDAERLAQSMLDMVMKRRPGHNDDDEVKHNHGDDQDDDDDAMDEALIDEMYSFVAHLVESQQISKHDGMQLENLIAAREVRVLAAFDAFGADRNLEELVDSLQRIAKLGLSDSNNEEEDAGVAGDDEGEAEMIHSKDDQYESSEEEEEEEEEEAALDFGETLHDEMFQDLGLSRQHLQALKAGILAKDPIAMAPLNDFVQTQNVKQLEEDFRVAAKRLADGPLAPAPQPSSPAKPKAANLPEAHQHAAAASDPLDEMMREGLVTKAQIGKIAPAMLKEAKAYFEMTGDELSFRETVLRLV